MGDMAFAESACERPEEFPAPKKFPERPLPERSTDSPREAAERFSTVPHPMKYARRFHAAERPPVKATRQTHSRSSQAATAWRLSGSATQSRMPTLGHLGPRSSRRLSP